MLHALGAWIISFLWRLLEHVVQTAQTVHQVIQWQLLYYIKWLWLQGQLQYSESKSS